MVPGGITHVIEIIVFAASTDALLSGGCALVWTLIKAQKDILKLIHACIGKQQCRVIPGNNGARGHNLMPFGGKKIEVGFANFGNFHTLNYGIDRILG